MLLQVSVDGETSQTIISGMGELHLEVYVERMRREYDVSPCRALALFKQLQPPLCWCISGAFAESAADPALQLCLGPRTSSVAQLAAGKPDVKWALSLVCSMLMCRAATLLTSPELSLPLGTQNIMHAASLKYW